MKHGAFVCSIDAAHQDLSSGMFILGVGSMVSVPEGFKSDNMRIFWGILKRISKQLWMAVTIDWVVLWSRVRYRLIELSQLYVPCTSMVYATVHSGYQTWSNLGHLTNILHILHCKSNKIATLDCCNY